MNHVGVWLPPILITAVLTVFGWLINNAVTNIVGKIDDLDAAFTRITSDLYAEHRALETHLADVDKRLTRVEGWKEMISLPGPQGEARRHSDWILRRQYDDDENNT